MTSDPKLAKSPLSEPSDEPVGVARCEFGDGHVEILYIAKLDRAAVWLHCGDSVRIGTPVSLELQIGETFLPTLSAQVHSYGHCEGRTTSRLLCLRFRAMSSRAARRLNAVVSLSASTAEPRTSAALSERRREPRLWLDTPARAVLTGRGGSRLVNVVTLSAGGALLTQDGAALSEAFEPGESLRLVMVFEAVPESLSLDARVVRRNAPSEPDGIGVRFIDVSDLTQSRLVGLLRYVYGS